ncbi:MAG: hypothetical protein H0W50_01410 [Parachlamydiaceae bacterium]|nr:hypothetical protein [Parachlamydiaceae bacterium]
MAINIYKPAVLTSTLINCGNENKEPFDLSGKAMKSIMKSLPPSGTEKAQKKAYESGYKASIVLFLGAFYQKFSQVLALIFLIIFSKQIEKQFSVIKHGEGPQTERLLKDFDSSTTEIDAHLDWTMIYSNVYVDIP